MLNSFYCPKAKETGIQFMKGVGPARATQFSKLGIKTAADLIDFYPRTHMDFSAGSTFENTVKGEVCSVNATVTGKAMRVPTKKKNITLYNVRVVDADGAVGRLIFFNNQYAAEALKDGKEYCFTGKIDKYSGRVEMTSPKYAALEDNENLMVPVYSQTKGLNSTAIAKVVKVALDMFLPLIEEPLTDEIRKEYGLCSLSYALRNIHFPIDCQAYELAKQRLVFGELLTFDLIMEAMKASAREGEAIKIPRCDMHPFVNALPFKLTECQINAVKQAFEDMASDKPMSRLLQGDVGSGKTAVCAALLYRTAQAGYQSALMAPTELLANQHYNTLNGLLSGIGVRCELLTGATKQAERKRILDTLALGEIDILIGTHALFSDNVIYKNLALVVADEQHRFGVRQRSKLAAKGLSPHFFVMSATPIPRTLALMLYGDLDISILDTLPKGRREIKTYIYKDKNRIRLFDFIKKEFNAGRQAYIVCPAIDDNESGKLAAAVYYEKAILPEFKQYKTALLHGRMAAAEKNAVMDDFIAGNTQLLVSTTVIEVGIDVPNATVMVIEDADSFGLAQMHQLRGRVGRGTHESYCVLVARACSDTAYERLNIMKDSSNGFEIADKDLKLRGPGDFLGERQSGLPILRLAGGLSDFSAIAAAKNAAVKLSENIPPILEKMIAEIRNEIAGGGLN
ncbi:MAG TPA: ATP-dependent DNA helicase RecG [Oscillospiraceae bacterium]|nr:ATP-dependent DNA helicase RecG [Oscillospiraceae bacterium]HPF56353.1 ATP-dependent DNA helicase RecG [Clostridiales bacterium]HPK35563.1 ATP-dependent DNA helicase RecG [Oscillospiraceae bacterium]HPR75925.1 ATP-dependent DNA helicase RecG [Oscillospiraceae bacterium]